MAREKYESQKMSIGSEVTGVQSFGEGFLSNFDGSGRALYGSDGRDRIFPILRMSWAIQEKYKKFQEKSGNMKYPPESDWR